MKSSNILIFITTLSLFIPTIAGTQEDFTVRFLEEVTERLIQRFGDRYLKQQNPIAVALIDSTETANLFFRKALVRYLNGRYFASDDPSSKNNEYLILRFNVLDWDVDFAFDNISQKVVRQGSLTLFFELENHPSGRIILQDDFREVYSDSIAVEQLNLLPVQTGELSNRNILKPILITGVTGVVVYLFYSLRSR